MAVEAILRDTPTIIFLFGGGVASSLLNDMTAVMMNIYVALTYSAIESNTE